MKLKLSPRLARLALTASCSCALLALALMVWSVLDPRPLPVVVAMSVGQAIGTLSLLLYLVVVGFDLRRRLADDEKRDS
jgi:hypothetical protein